MVAGKVPRILVLIDQYWPHMGGAEAVAKTICDLLQGREFEFSVVTRNFSGELPKTETVDGVRITRLGTSRSRKISKIQFMFSAIGYLIRHRRDYDLVHVHLQQLDIDLLSAFIASWVTGQPYVLHVHRSEAVPWMLKLKEEHPFLNLFKPNPLPGWLYRSALRRASLILTVESTSADLLERRGIGRTRYLPNAVRLRDGRAGSEGKEELRKRLGLTPDATIVVAVGVLRKEKNILTLLKAWAEMAGRQSNGSMELVILGGTDNSSNSNEAELRAFASEHGLESVLFKGSVSNVGDYLKAADIYVHPSFVEGMSLAILEAMNCKLPVVVSDIPGNRDLVPSDEYGLRFDPRHSEELASGLQKLAMDRDLRRNLGERALRRVNEEFSLERLTQKVASLYREVVAAENGAGG